MKQRHIWETEIHRQTDRLEHWEETDGRRQRYTERDRQSNRQTDRETGKDRKDKTEKDRYRL